MLQRHTAPGVEPLVEVLAEVLAEPLADPMASELVLAPTQGMLQWLRERLARSLGTSPGRTDGVVANVRFGFPGLLRQEVLATDRPPGRPDPWAVDHLAWTVLAVLRDTGAEPGIGPLAALPDGATWYGRARRLADLLDRYDLRRPAMVRAWADGADVDGNGDPLAEHHRWQPRLWRLVRARVGVPSPAEREPRLLEDLAAGRLRPALPPRLFLFGLTSPLAGLGPELLEALGAHHDVHLLVAEPSPGLARRARSEGPAALAPGAVRGDEHPLLASWARPARAAAVTWAGVPEAPTAPDTSAAPSATAATGAPPDTLLARLQADVRAGGVPAGELRLGEGDRSVQVHACHGERRQVEVLRDALGHLLAEDPTLTEEDVVVLCPRLEVFAPLVESVFGPPAGTDPTGDATGAPRLAHRIADRTLRDTYPTLAALGALVSLVGGRFNASAVLDFIRTAPVRLRYGFGDEDLATIVGWVGDAGVRWGLDAGHRRAVADIPDHAALTWRAALDRLLVGATTSEDDRALAPGDVLPMTVEGAQVAVAGRLADLLGRLAALADAAATARPMPAWCDLLAEAADALFAAPPDAPWQLARLADTLRSLSAAAEVGGGHEVDLTLAEVRRVLADHLDGEPRRPGFFRGGITVTTLTPLRGIPHRVVAVLGLDEGALPGAGSDGDDLVAAAALPGDTDPRSEGRQALLEAVLAAGDHLVITRTGHSVVTNLAVPPATPLAELRDALRLTVHSADHDHLEARLELHHPRQSFDERNFVAGGVVPGAGPWSFDPVELAGARARLGERVPPRPFMDAPLPDAAPDVVALAELRQVLRDPVPAFLRQRLGIHLAAGRGSASEELPTRLAGLDEWQAADRLLGVLRAGGDRADWQAREVAQGVVPPGRLGDAALDEVATTVEAILERARSLGYGATDPVLHQVDATVAATRVVGAVEVHAGPEPGPFTISYSKKKDVDRLVAWLDLLALTVDDPSTRWRAVVLCRPENKRKDPVEVIQLRLAGDDAEARLATATDALAVALDCYRRSRCEPFPLFPKFSSALASGRNASAKWRRRGGSPVPGEGDKPAARVVFGDLSYRDLLALPARPDDPPGEAPGRVLRCAQYLWGTLERSLAPEAPAATEVSDAAGAAP